MLPYIKPFETMNYFMKVWLLVANYMVLRYFLLAGLVFLLVYVVFRRQLSPFRLQPKYPSRSDYGRDILFSVLTMLIFTTVATLVLFVFRDYTRIYGSIDEYGRAYYVFTFVWMFFLHDTYFYWMHRCVHHPLLYRHVHLTHHRSTNPTPWTSYAFHPFEALLEVAIVPLIVFSLPVHFSAVVLFMLFQFLFNIYGHLGIEILPARWQKTRLLGWINTSTHHNAHHRYVRGNYGLYTLIWDRLMGTLRK